MKGSFQAQQAAAVAVRIGVDVLQGGRCVGMPEESLNLGHFTAPARQFGCAGMAKVMEPDRPQAVLREQSVELPGQRIRSHRSAVPALEYRAGTVSGLALVPAQQRLQAGRQRERPAARAGLHHLRADHAAAAGLVMGHDGVAAHMQLTGVEINVIPAQPADFAAAQPVDRGQQHRQIEVGTKVDG